LFSLYQLLWQQGCEKTNASSNQNIKPAIQCRSDLLTYTLQFLLSNRSVFDHQSDYYRITFLPSLLASWKRHWPKGLLISDPDIPNRDPLLITANTDTIEKVTGNFSDKAASTLNTMLSKNDVSAKFEPLNYRTPLDNWSAQTKDLDKTLIAGLGGFIPATDIQQLDQQLKEKSLAKTQKIKLSCQIAEKILRNKISRIKFSCESPETANSKHVNIMGRFELANKKWQSGKLSRLTFDRQTQLDLILKSTAINTGSEKYNAQLEIFTSSNFSQQNDLLTARISSGNAIKSLNLSWRKGSTGKYPAELVIHQDFDFVKTAIAKMAKMTASNETDALSDKPFRRASVMKFILNDLGAPANHWCCVDDNGLPDARLQDPDNEAVIVAQAANPEIAPFYHYCATCHRTSNHQPPNFLQGNEEQVTKQISQCAERIYFRLSMWHQKAQQRAKSPMPPVTALHNLGFSQLRWTTSDELLSLKHATEKLITRKTGKQPDIEQFIKTGFSNLPECLSDS